MDFTYSKKAQGIYETDDIRSWEYEGRSRCDKAQKTSPPPAQVPKTSSANRASARVKSERTDAIVSDDDDDDDERASTPAHTEYVKNRNFCFLPRKTAFTSCLFKK